MKSGKDYKDQRDKDYVEQMVSAKQSQSPHVPLKKLTPEEILAMQPASTRAVLTRDPSLDAEYQNRPISTIGQSTFGDLKKDLDKLVAKRDIDAADAALVEEMRRGSKNTTGDSVSQGASSITPERKERAKEAFSYSKPTSLTPEQQRQAKELNEIQKLGEIQAEEPPKDGFFKKVRNKLWPKEKVEGYVPPTLRKKLEGEDE